jgi:SHS2 domain-containing protein
MAGGFREIEHTADRAMQVWADSFAGLCEQAAAGMFALMAGGDLSAIGVGSQRCVALEAGDAESALIGWLNELLFLRETRRELYRRFAVSWDGSRLLGQCAGGPGSPTHGVIKAATFHDLHVRVDAAGVWRATIVFDT